MAARLPATPRQHGTSPDAAYSQLERRWTAEAQAHVARLEALLARHSALLAAMHYSRGVAWRWGWAPWKSLLQQVRDQTAAGQRLHSRHCLCRALAAWAQAHQVAAWQAVGRDACAMAGARRQRQHALLRCALAVLQRRMAWARCLPQQRARRLAVRALRIWRQQATAAKLQLQLLLAAAARHSACRTRRRALAAWQLGAARCRQELVVAARREQRWDTVQRYLQERRQAKAAKQGSGYGDEQLLRGQSSGENSFNPNAIFFGMRGG